MEDQKKKINEWKSHVCPLFFISSGLGFVYHGVLTGNQFMQTRMSWSVSVSAGQNSSNLFIFR